MTAELDKIENNVKRHIPIHAVDAYIGVFPHKLIKGNTKDTLPKFVKRKIGIDFAFIDGGHSIETITSDFKNVSKIMNKGGVIVLDDFYTPPIEGVGCNEIVKDIKHELLPEQDKMAGKKHVINMVRVNV
jgi:predicted O-methyltransferase YrrM